MSTLQASKATDAFTRQSAVFDAIDAADPLIHRMRSIVRESALKQCKPGDTLLELNAGTGIDSFYFAEKGLNVLATDAATGMVQQLRAKQQASSFPVEVEQCSFLDLAQLGDRKFKHVFSNFGGLNCTDRMDSVMLGIDNLLLPGGTCALVIMPRFSPWETITALKGNFELAFRRFRKGSTPAHLEGIVFPCYYYSPDYVNEHLGTNYELLELRALSLVVPPPHVKWFPTKYPRTMRLLDRIEERIAHWWPFRNWGDHFLIILRKKG